MTARRKRSTDRLPSRLPDPQSDQWLGGEAHVRFQGEPRSWRDLLQGHRKGLAGLALAFLAGIAFGIGVTTLTCRKR